mgnify:CR=1 FL=1
MSDIRSKVIAIIVDKLNVEESEVTDGASFTNDLGADSLDTVELIMEFEKQFGISIQGNGGNTSFEFGDNQTRVRNDVYKEQGMPFLQNRYQRPYYRANPFRVNRGVYYDN